MSAVCASNLLALAPTNFQPTQDLPFFMPDQNVFLARIHEFLQPLVKPGQSLNDDSELITELGLTSLQVMELIEQIEDQFDISIPLNILPDIRTISDLAGKLEELTS